MKMIEVNNVSMRFNMAKEKHESLKEYFLAAVQGKLQFEEFYALRDVSLTVHKGEFHGIIGLNGSGKSTLLKVISGVFKPTAGNVVVHGSIAPLIELGAGFDMDLTARENIYLNGTVLGLTPKYIDEKFDEIVDFSELREFLDVPLKNYSSGMVARIAFAIATITKPDVLIADEILSVGDFMFQEKCEERMRQLMSGGTTVLLVSHSIGQIERMCDHVTWLEKGRVKMQGEAAEVCAAYKALDPEAAARFDAALRQIAVANAGRTIAVFAHGSVIRQFLALAQSIPESGWAALPLSGAGELDFAAAKGIDVKDVDAKDIRASLREQNVYIPE